MHIWEIGTGNIVLNNFLLWFTIFVFDREAELIIIIINILW